MLLSRFKLVTNIKQVLPKRDGNSAGFPMVTFKDELYILIDFEMRKTTIIATMVQVTNYPKWLKEPFYELEHEFDVNNQQLQDLSIEVFSQVNIMRRSDG